MTNKELYGDIPRITDNIRSGKGYCILQATVQGARTNLCPGFSTGTSSMEKKDWYRPNLTYIDLLKQDTGLKEPDIKTAMLDRSVWRAITVRANVST